MLETYSWYYAEFRSLLSKCAELSNWLLSKNELVLFYDYKSENIWNKSFLSEKLDIDIDISVFLKLI